MGTGIDSMIWIENSSFAVLGKSIIWAFFSKEPLLWATFYFIYSFFSFFLGIFVTEIRWPRPRIWEKVSNLLIKKHLRWQLIWKIKCQYFISNFHLIIVAFCIWKWWLVIWAMKHVYSKLFNMMYTIRRVRFEQTRSRSRAGLYDPEVEFSQWVNNTYSFAVVMHDPWCFGDIWNPSVVLSCIFRL